MVLTSESLRPATCTSSLGRKRGSRVRHTGPSDNTYGLHSHCLPVCAFVRERRHVSRRTRERVRKPKAMLFGNGAARNTAIGCCPSHSLRVIRCLPCSSSVAPQDNLCQGMIWLDGRKWAGFDSFIRKRGGERQFVSQNVDNCCQILTPGPGRVERLETLGNES